MRRALPVVLLVLAAGCGGKSPSHAAIAFVTPSGATWTNGVVHVELETSKPGVRADLLLDGQPLATGIAFPYRYDWDTTAVAEGSHALQAKVGSVSTLPVTVVVDRTPPAVVSRTPAPDAPNVSVHDPVHVVFSEPLDPATVTDGSVVLTGDGAVDLGKSLVLTSGFDLEIVPAGAYAPGTISAALAGTIADRAGNALAATGWSWTAPEWYDLGAFPETSFARVVAYDDTAAGIYVANTENDGSFDDIEVLLRGADGAWNLVGQPDEIDPGAGNAALTRFFPDSAGAPVVAYKLSPPGGGFDAYVARWNGANWVTLGGAKLASATPGALGAYFGAAPEPGGKLLAAFSDTSGLLQVFEWNGMAWTDITFDVAGSFTGPFRSPDILLAGGTPVITFRDGGSVSHVRELVGTGWFDLVTYNPTEFTLTTLHPAAGGGFWIGGAAPTGGAFQYQVRGTTTPMLGGPLTSVPTLQDPIRVAAIDGTMYAGVDASGLDAFRWQCQVFSLSGGVLGEWLPVGGILNLDPANNCALTSLAAGPGGLPLVGLEEEPVNPQDPVLHRVVILNR